MRPPPVVELADFLARFKTHSLWLLKWFYYNLWRELCVFVTFYKNVTDGRTDTPSYRDARMHLKQGQQSNVAFLSVLRYVFCHGGGIGGFGGGGRLWGFIVWKGVPFCVTFKLKNAEFFLSCVFSQKRCVSKTQFMRFIRLKKNENLCICLKWHSFSIYTN